MCSDPPQNANFKLVEDLSPNSEHVVLHEVFLTSFHCDVTTAQPLNGPFDCDVTMKKSANRCDVGPLAKGQLNKVFLDDLPVKFRHIPFSGCSMRSQTCLSQSDARAAILVFQPTPKNINLEEDIAY